MSVVPTNAAQSLASLGQAERVTVRDKAKEDERKARAREQDAFERAVVKVEIAQAARSLKGNDQEEAHEDREGSTPAPNRRPHPKVGAELDIEG